MFFYPLLFSSLSVWSPFLRPSLPQDPVLLLLPLLCQTSWACLLPLPSRCPLLSLCTEQGSPGSRPGCPRSSCRARWLKLFPGLRPQQAPLCHRATASLGASFGRTVHLARAQLKCSACEAVALESRVLGVSLSSTCTSLEEGVPRTCAQHGAHSQQELPQWVVTERTLGASHCCMHILFIFTATMLWGLFLPSP